MADLSVFEQNESAVRSYSRNFPVVFDRARGALLWDEDDRQYIDLLSGAGTLNYGHNPPSLKRTLVEYIANDRITHGLDLATVAKRRFIETFTSVILHPRGLDYRLQFTGPTGTNAVEAALKVARQATGRSNVVAFTNSFHGVSVGSLAVTANRKYRSAARTGLGDASFLPYDGYLGAGTNTLEYLRKLLDDPSGGLDMPAAVIVETVQGEGGLNAASNGWLQELQALCRLHEIILIVDDIQAGIGRTGSFFSFEDAGIVPDIVILSKSLSGYGLPMSLVLIRPDLDVWQPGAHSGTFRGNNLAFECAAEAIEQFWTTDEFERATRNKGLVVFEELQRLALLYPDAGLQVRGRGLMIGLASTSRPKLAGEVSRLAFERGVIVETSGGKGEVLKLLPPLMIEDDLLTSALAAIGQSLHDAVEGRTAERSPAA